MKGRSAGTLVRRAKYVGPRITAPMLICLTMMTTWDAPRRFGVGFVANVYIA